MIGAASFSCFPMNVANQPDESLSILNEAASGHVYQVGGGDPVFFIAQVSNSTRDSRRNAKVDSPCSM